MLGFEYLSTFWRSYVLVVAPVLLMPVALADNGSEEMRCAYVALIMAVYWVSEALPLPVTSLIPMVALPLLGIMSTSEVSVNYLKATNFMFLGGLILALAIEHSGLHLRLALSIMLLVGTSPRSILFGFMITTGFLSMWISNTATTAMMLPIVDGIYQVMSEQELEEEMRAEVEMQALQSGTFQKTMNPEAKAKLERQRNIMLLAVAYAANIGGTAVITGSPPNLVVPQVMTERFGPNNGITFASWMAFCVPLMAINLVFAYFWLLILSWRPKKASTNRPLINHREVESFKEHKEHQAERIKNVILQKYAALGPISTHEISILICFVVVIILWFFRQPLFMPGWGDLFVFETARGKTVTVGSATPAILMVLVAFALPTTFNFWPFHPLRTNQEPSKSLIDWKLVETKLPWGIIFLLGGGLALSDACEKSRLSQWIVQRLMVLEGMAPWAINLIVCILTALITQVASNTATANVLLPILTDLSLTICQNPIYLVMSAALTCSYAFMLPVATAPNAIVFGASTMKMMDMLVAGAGMNAITLMTTAGAINTFGTPIFSLDAFPEWAVSSLSSNHSCNVSADVIL